MALVDRGSLEIEFRDYDKEPTSITFFRENVAAVDWETEQPLYSGVVVALDALLLGKRSKVTQSPIVTADVPVERSTNTSALREVKWRLIFRDSVTLDQVTARIGTADMTLAGVRIVGTDKADMTHALWVALKDALDDYGVINPQTGNAMTLVDAELIGWND